MLQATFLLVSSVKQGGWFLADTRCSRTRCTCRIHQKRDRPV